MKHSKHLIMLVLVLGFFSPSAIAHDPSEDEPTEQRSYREGTLWLGAFWIGRFDTSLTARADDFPLGIVVDLSRELGLGDSVTVPRGIFSYRFSRRHQLNLEYFRVRRTSRTEIGRTIEIGDNEFPIGGSVSVESKSRVYKASYTWVFYDRHKVRLGATFGLNVIDFDVGLTADTINMGDDVVSERTARTTPLPVLGLRLHYRATRKLGLVVAADVLILETGSYEGTFHDSYAMVDWRFSKRFSIGGGLNFLSLDLRYDRDLIAELRHSYRGVAGFIGIHF
jgi:hypothetical protein